MPCWKISGKESCLLGRYKAYVDLCDIASLAPWASLEQISMTTSLSSFILPANNTHRAPWERAISRLPLLEREWENIVFSSRWLARDLSPLVYVTCSSFVNCNWWQCISSPPFTRGMNPRRNWFQRSLAAAPSESAAVLFTDANSLCRHAIWNNAAPSRVILPSCHFQTRAQGNAWGLGVAAEDALVFWKRHRLRRPFTNIIGEVAKLPQEQQRMDWTVGTFEDMLFVTIWCSRNMLHAFSVPQAICSWRSSIWMTSRIHLLLNTVLINHLQFT